MDKLIIFRISLVLGLGLASEAFCETDTAGLPDQALPDGGSKNKSSKDKKKPAKKSGKGSEKKQAKKSNSGSEQVSPMTEALSSAYTTNSAFKAQLYKQFANDEEVSKALSRFRPSIQAQASAGSTWQRQKVAQSSPGTNPITVPVVPGPGTITIPGTPPVNRKVTTDWTNRPEQAQVSISQNIFRGGGDLANLWASESFVKAGEFELLNTEQTTLQNAANAYMQVIFQTSAVKSYELNVSYLEEQLKSKKAQLQVGEVTATDVASSESELAKGMAQLATARSQLEDAKANYVQVIGEQPGLLEYPKQLPDLPKSLNEAINSALHNNPTILNALYTAKQEGFKIDAATAALLPSIDVSGVAQRSLNQSRGNNDQTNSLQALVTLSVPIYNKGGEDYATIRQQVENTAAARYNLEQARKKTIEETTKAWDAWIAAQEQIKDLTVQVAAATKARDNAAKEASVGERSYTEVLTFQSQLITAEVNLEQAKRDLVISWYGLYNAMGILTAEQLGLPVAINKVQAHYRDVKWKLFGFGETPTKLEQKDEQLECAEID